MEDEYPADFFEDKGLQCLSSI